jgi:hypothetical protein
MPARGSRSPLILLLLKYPLFALIALAATAALAWHVTRGGAGTVKPGAASPETLLSAALLAFYTDPSAGRDDVVARIRAYRRSFPDATPNELMDPAYILTCNIRSECLANKERQDQLRDVLEEETARQFSNLPRHSPAFHAALTAAYATDRRFPVSIALNRIQRYPRAYDREQDLLKLQADFFRIIDAVVKVENFDQNRYRADPKYAGTVYDYLDLYLNKAPETLQPVPFSCSNSAYLRQRDFYAYVPSTDADCSAAVADYERWEKQHQEAFSAYWRSSPDPFRDPEYQPFMQRLLREKAAAFQKLLAERRADRDFIRDKATRFLRPYFPGR